jgi:hypothetical protein
MMFVFGANSASTGYNLTRSLRFRASASAYLSRTNGTPTSATTWTWSAWVKRGALGGVRSLTGAGQSSGTNYSQIIFNVENLIVEEYSGSANYAFQTSQVFRDPSAWYHIIVAMDTTQATTTNRVKIYVNGSQVTAFVTATYPALNYATFYNTNAYIKALGSIWFNGAVGSNYFDGYLTEVNFIDGQALTPSSFGSTNALTGVWQPARYTGTYGTNGFYLPFSVSSTSSYAGLTNGSSQYLSIASSNALQFGLSDYTAEMWVLRTSQAAQAFVVGGGGAIFQWGLNTSGTMQVSLAGGGSVTASTGTVPLNVWSHIAVARVSGTLTYYINGVASGSYSDTNNYSTGSLTVNISATNNNAGYGLVGYLSNVRVVKGTAVYTAAFTPPSAPLTAITNTSLLTLQNATIIDNSTNAASITNNGSVATSVVYPFTLNVAADASGNNNNWTTNNISLAAGVTYDSMTDVPTLTSATASNFAVLNPLTGDGTISNANLTIDWVGGNSSKPATIGVTSGKWYCEITLVAAATNAMFAGIIPASMIPSASYPGSASGGYGFFGDGQKYFNGVNSAYGTAISVGQIVGIAFDLDNGKLWFSRNGTWQASGDPAAGTNAAFTSIAAGTWFLSTGHSGSCTLAANFGQRPFSYTPPTGFVALNAFNLPTSTILKGNTVMDATLWTGDGTSPRTITNAASFQPDLVWFKSRSTTFFNQLSDSVRGATRSIYSNVTNAEENNAVNGYLSSINSNGFSVINGSSSGGSVNANGTTYVAWQWQAGQGSSSSNTNGTITSTVSVNASAGFSVVTYTGTGANATLGHGLGVAPQLIFIKSRSATGFWIVYSAVNGATKYLTLNTTDAVLTNAGPFNNTAPTSSVFSVGNSADVNTNGATYVAYCWTPIAGYSAFGSYTGNGSTDGPFVYTGFRPKFVLVKRTDSAGTNWDLYDTARNTYNAMDLELFPNSSSAEYDGDRYFDFLSNGFKLRTSVVDSNASGGTYIYAAFAENPFKNALAR